ncbi:transposable element Tcb1 transposase [Trichonephila clavipes]|nr:transposable element Tcb1 transposase [Trichonephila clavipes]
MQAHIKACCALICDGIQGEYQTPQVILALSFLPRGRHPSSDDVNLYQDLILPKASKPNRHSRDSCMSYNHTKANIHSLPKVKHGEENANFRKPIRIEEDAIRCRGRWNQAESQSDIHTCDTSMVTASIGKVISAGTVRRRLHMNGLYARVPRVGILLSVQSRGARLKWCQEHGYRTDLHIIKSGSVTAVRYRDEVKESIVRLYAAAVGSTFHSMDDNARPHRADIVDDNLKCKGIARMAWPAYSLNLNPIENLWDALGRSVS